MEIESWWFELLNAFWLVHCGNDCIELDFYLNTLLAITSKPERSSSSSSFSSSSLFNDTIVPPRLQAFARLNDVLRKLVSLGIDHLLCATEYLLAFGKA